MSTDQTPSERPSAAAPDVGELVTDLEAGMFERSLSVAMSQTALSVMLHGKKGKVSIEFEIDNIPGTSQVRVGHTIKYARPTASGKSSEEVNGATVLHVGKGGRLSLSQADLFKAPEQKGLKLDGKSSS